jgi:hypothetical protein
MELIETSGIEGHKTNQQQSNLQKVETKTAKDAQSYGSRVEVPCCCPGCFPFDF